VAEDLLGACSLTEASAAEVGAIVVALPAARQASEEAVSHRRCSVLSTGWDAQSQPEEHETRRGPFGRGEEGIEASCDCRRGREESRRRWVVVLEGARHRRVEAIGRGGDGRQHLRRRGWLRAARPAGKRAGGRAELAAVLDPDRQLARIASHPSPLICSSTGRSRRQQRLFISLCDSHPARRCL
jgi:hypothetical protein